MEGTCLVTGCTSNHIHLRGLCRSDYIFAASLVFHRIVTWKQLEAAGCVLPATGAVQSPKRPERVEFFSKATGFPPDVVAKQLRDRTNAYIRSRRRRGTGKGYLNAGK